jgi:hypothetical protein
MASSADVDVRRVLVNCPTLSLTLFDQFGSTQIEIELLRPIAEESGGAISPVIFHPACIPSNLKHSQLFRPQSTADF